MIRLDEQAGRVLLPPRAALGTGVARAGRARVVVVLIGRLELGVTVRTRADHAADSTEGLGHRARLDGALEAVGVRGSRLSLGAPWLARTRRYVICLIGRTGVRLQQRMLNASRRHPGRAMERREHRAWSYGSAPTTGTRSTRSPWPSLPSSLPAPCAARSSRCSVRLSCG